MSGGLPGTHKLLLDACRTVSGVRVVDRPGVVLDPPAVYVSPPSLTWEAYELDTAEAVFEVVLAVAANDRAVEQLYELLPQVTAALDSSEADAVVKTAEPGVWQSGTVGLPCYFIRVEAAI